MEVLKEQSQVFWDEKSSPEGKDTGEGSRHEASNTQDK